LSEAAVFSYYDEVTFYFVLDERVIGTMHQLYFSGTPAVQMALRAAFSAVEMVPLLLITLDASALSLSGGRSVAGERHPHP